MSARPTAPENPMDAYKTHGAFSWSELVAPDPDKALAFYGPLFGWKHETSDMGGGPYHVLKVGDASVGGVMQTPPDAPGRPAMWQCYITVDDIDATARQCAELGGTVCAGPMDIPGVGRMAVLQDPQGAVFSAITYSMEG
jgi:predicted enzyme related to lactoylglutathione lyase